jgi:hypothetical protein
MFLAIFKNVASEREVTDDYIIAVAPKKRPKPRVRNKGIFPILKTC